MRKSNIWWSTTFFVLLFGLSSIGNFSSAQTQTEDEEQQETEDSYYQKPSILDRLAPGGNFSLQFGTITFIDVSPLIGYRFTNNFVAGPGFTYRYLRFQGFEATSTYGPRAFARYIIRRQFFLQADYENLSVEFVSRSGQELTREWVPGLFVGGGLFQPIGQRAGFMIGAFYNLSHDNLRSPYNSPWVFNVGFTF
ncbi:MAG: hypothetical protein ACFB15_12340 [Cyclobacteriaceae bacterium]